VTVQTGTDKELLFKCVAETLDGGGGGLPDQPDAVAFKNLLDWELINSMVGSV
jgi:hypothetical protein